MQSFQADVFRERVLADAQPTAVLGVGVDGLAQQLVDDVSPLPTHATKPLQLIQNMEMK